MVKRQRTVFDRFYRRKEADQAFTALRRGGFRPVLSITGGPMQYEVSSLARYGVDAFYPEGGTPDKPASLFVRKR